MRNRHLDRRQCPRQKDGGGDHRAGRDLLLDRKKGTDRQNERLHEQPFDLRDRGDQAAAVAPARVVVEGALLHAKPEGPHGAEHAHGMRSLAVAPALFGEEPTFLGCLVRGRERAARNEFIEDREREARDRRGQGGHAQQPMHGKDDSQIDRREGHVEQGEGSRPGNELPHGHKIADRLATDAGRTAQAMGHHGIEDPSPQRLVHPATDPADNALADVIQGSVEGIEHGQEDGQGYERIPLILKHIRHERSSWRIRLRRGEARRGQFGGEGCAASARQLCADTP